MRTNEEHVLILRIKGERPDSLAGQPTRFGIYSSPGNATVRRPENSASDLSSLICIAGKDLIAISWIDQNGGEVAKG
jgi:hypothetical protein